MLRTLTFLAVLSVPLIGDAGYIGGIYVPDRIVINLPASQQQLQSWENTIISRMGQLQATIDDQSQQLLTWQLLLGSAVINRDEQQAAYDAADEAEDVARAAFFADPTGANYWAWQDAVDAEVLALSSLNLAISLFNTAEDEVNTRIPIVDDMEDLMFGFELDLGTVQGAM